ncbi:MAG: phytanoyl-CoA dioxygenase family protein [Janthinobacterium lividum]
MLTDEQVEFFRENGFLNYGRVLTDEQLTTLRESLARVLDGSSTASPQAVQNIGGSDTSVVAQVVNVWEAEPAFAAHLSNDVIVPMIAQLMGTDTVRVWHDQMQLKPEHIGGPTIWHQDHPYWPIIQPADLVSAWVALEDATVENGAMSMVARSHLWGQYAKGTIGINADYTPSYDPAFVPDGETVEIVPCEVSAGGVVFHHCRTWHGAPANHSDNPRPAIAVHYMPGWVRYEPQPGASHMVEQHIHVQPGEPLTGDHFPTVMENGKIQSVA